MDTDSSVEVIEEIEQHENVSSKPKRTYQKKEPKSKMIIKKGKVGQPKKSNDTKASMKKIASPQTSALKA
jgi:hypothetical protein